jgi:hypothetical protein
LEFRDRALSGLEIHVLYLRDLRLMGGYLTV